MQNGQQKQRVFKRMGLRLQDDQCPESRAEVELRRNSRVYCTAILLPVYIFRTSDTQLNLEFFFVWVSEFMSGMELC